MQTNDRIKAEQLLNHYETHFYNHEHYNYYSYIESIGPFLISVKNVDSVFLIYIRSVLGFKLISIDLNFVMHKLDEVFILKIALDQYFILVFSSDWIIKPESKIKSVKKNLFNFFTGDQKVKEFKNFTNLEEIKNKILTNLKMNKEIFLSMHIINKAVAISIEDKELCISDNLIKRNDYVINIVTEDVSVIKELLGTEILKKSIFSLSHIKTLHKVKETPKKIVYKEDKVELKQRIKDFLLSEMSYNSDIQRILECIFYEIIDKNELKGNFFYLQGIINNIICVRDFSFELLTKLLNIPEIDVDLLRSLEFKESYEERINLFMQDKEPEIILEFILNIFLQEISNLNAYRTFLIQSFDYSEKLFTKDEFTSLNLPTSNILTWKTIFKRPHQKLCHYVLFMENFAKFLPNNSQNFNKCIEIVKILKEFLTEINNKKVLINAIEETIKFKKNIKEGNHISCTEDKVFIHSFDSKLEDKLSVALFSDSIALLCLSDSDKFEIIFKTDFKNVEIKFIGDTNLVVVFENKEYKLSLTTEEIDLFSECFYVLKHHFSFSNDKCIGLFYKKIDDKKVFYYIKDKNSYLTNQNENEFALISTEFNDIIKFTNNKTFLYEFNAEQLKLRRHNFNTLEFIDEVSLENNSDVFARTLIEEIKKYLMTPPFSDQSILNLRNEIEKIPRQKERIFKKEIKSSFNYFNLINYEKLDFLFDYVHFYLINVHNESNFASRDELSIVKSTNELTFFKSLTSFNDLEYNLNGLKISQKKMNQLIFYDDLFLPYRNTIKEIYGEFSKEEEVSETYLSKYRIEDLTSLIAYWFNQNLFTMFSSDDLNFIKKTCLMGNYLTFNDLFDMCFISTKSLFKRYITFIFEVHKFIKHESIYRLLNIFSNNNETIDSFMEVILRDYNR